MNYGKGRKRKWCVRVCVCVVVSIIQSYQLPGQPQVVLFRVALKGESRVWMGEGRGMLW